MNHKYVAQAVVAGTLLAGGLPAWPQAAVTSKLELENEQVRIERLSIPPGNVSAMHSHALPGLEVFLTDDHIRETLADGTTREWRAKANEVLWTGAGTHRVENLRNAATEIIVITFKALPPAAARTAAAASSEEFENAWVKVTRGRLPAKAKGPVHTHPQYIGVILSDARVRAHMTDGTTRDLTGKRGEVSWRAPVTHSIENLADAPFEAIDVNIKPQGM